MTETMLAPSLSSRRTLVVLAGTGSFALLLGAWFFQYALGYAPCAMCYWQRWPHIAAVVIAVLAAARLPSGVAMAIGAAGGLAAASTAGIGIYHTGVERAWWPGPASCSGAGPDLGSLSGADLLDPTAAAPIVMCDEVAWQFLGLSMASWNAVASLGLAAIWALSVWRARSGPREGVIA